MVVLALFSSPANSVKATRRGAVRRAGFFVSSAMLTSRAVSVAGRFLFQEGKRKRRKPGGVCSVSKTRVTRKIVCKI
jgi:hypothetical protein